MADVVPMPRCGVPHPSPVAVYSGLWMVVPEINGLITVLIVTVDTTKVLQGHLILGA